MWKANMRDGTTVLVDDYYAGYKWIDENTPKDARVMAWWDYGYQITGVANRTSIADGNTWNHEHIATLGYMLTSPEKKAHKYIRHMADYVLVWAGGRGDDMGKSPHLARIANSVFPDHCGDKDPKCERFGFYRGGQPTPMMEKSLLYKLVKNGIDAQATVDETLFQEVYKSKYGFMRVYAVLNVSKASKTFGADESNRDCDAPGSWYCTGNYPPALKPLIEKRINFKQLEDFNKQGGEKSAYTKLIEKQKRGEI
jgi:dolichyl-diphosphooligosaccharide--protein glycosyltransferase